MGYSMPTASDESRLYGHVASLSCQRPGCGISGRTQVTHSNQQRDGKGMGIKVYPWRVAALCAECHQEIDHGNALSKAERRELWDEAHRKTIGQLFELGLIRPV